MGTGQVLALLPLLLRGAGIDAADVPRFVGLFVPLIFAVGLPFVPFWGVWADKYSRKAVVVRSAAVETIVLVGTALSGAPWQLAISVGLMGLALGNTGVMLAMLRETAPRARLGLVVATMSAVGPIGFALGPALAAVLVDVLGRPLRDVFLLSAALTAASTTMLAIGVTEVRPTVVPTDGALRLAVRALRGTILDPTTRALFLLFGGTLLAGQMIGTYLPLVVEHAIGTGPGLVSAIGLVVGGSALFGSVATPLTGALGDKVGFRRVLAGGLAASAAATATLSAAPTVPVLAAVATAYALANNGSRAMILALLSVEVPAAQRSATLNLVYLPLYLAGIAGPIVASALVLGGLTVVYLAAALVLAVCAAAALRPPRTAP